MTEAIDGRRNGAIPLKVDTFDLELDEIGYPGWSVTVRTNPRASTFDDLLAIDDMPRWWAAFGAVVREWNFADEDGQPFPLPRDVATERDLDLPVGVIGFIYRKYFEAFRDRVGLPKVPDASSATTSTTNGASPDGARAPDHPAPTSPSSSPTASVEPPSVTGT